MPKDATAAADLAQTGFARLVEIMARLRAPGGCPWDREQTFDTIKPYLLEETYEVMDAIDARDWPGLAEELGDLLLQVVFFAQMASESGYFEVADSVEAINRKLIRRHPHVFGEGDAKTTSDVVRRWDEIKVLEKEEKAKKERKAKESTEAAKQTGLLSGVPRSLPALVEAQQISSKAARSGFEWRSIDEVFAKLQEELTELDEARAGGTHVEIESEIGDLLFTVVNIARFLKVDPEQALRGSNARFRRRFGRVEEGLAQHGKTTSDASLDEMEALWQRAKQAER
ncbi:MAG TPA: nucleoside triphosphate pyrophosphohydrolase [Bryobacteraceae bacterium]|nr:nucleoside triphosphate pyrophosphohydrolase [Bryobacteraceae bacterium]